MAATDIDTHHDEEAPEPLRDRPFNPWRIPASAKTEAIVQEVLHQLQVYERVFKLRRRKRKKADQETFEAAVTAIVCDLMHYNLCGQGHGVFVTRSNVILGQQGRYRPPAYTKALPVIMDRLASPEMAFIELSIGHEGFFGPAKRTTMKPGKRLLTRIDTHALSLEDLGLSDEQEVILLKSSKEDFWDEGELIDYEDTPTTTEFRGQVIAINGWLEQANLDFDELYAGEGKVVDTTNRRLRRIFTQGRFDSGGRLFGGFWQTLNKDKRKEGLWIDDEQAMELDYGQAAPRILYGLCGVEPAFDDAYLIPGFEEYRPGIKKVMNSMLFTTKPLSRMPKGVRKQFADKHRVSEVVEAIQVSHTALKDSFFTGIGHDVQFIESQIIIDVVLRMREEGVTALPVHDAILVPSSKVDVARDVMLSCFLHHTGVQGMVAINGR